MEAPATATTHTRTFHLSRTSLPRCFPPPRPPLPLPHPHPPTHPGHLWGPAPSFPASAGRPPAWSTCSPPGAPAPEQRGKCRTGGGPPPLRQGRGRGAGVGMGRAGAGWDTGRHEKPPGQDSGGGSGGGRGPPAAAGRAHGAVTARKAGIAAQRPERHCSGRSGTAAARAVAAGSAAARHSPCCRRQAWRVGRRTRQRAGAGAAAKLMPAAAQAGEAAALESPQAAPVWNLRREGGRTGVEGGDRVRRGVGGSGGGACSGRAAGRAEGRPCGQYRAPPPNTPPHPTPPPPHRHRRCHCRHHATTTISPPTPPHPTHTPTPHTPPHPPTLRLCRRCSSTSRWKAARLCPTSTSASTWRRRATSMVSRARSVGCGGKRGGGGGWVRRR